jgi:hypothetical protein
MPRRRRPRPTRIEDITTAWVWCPTGRRGGLAHHTDCAHLHRHIRRRLRTGLVTPVVALPDGPEPWMARCEAKGCCAWLDAHGGPRWSRRP